MHRELRPRRSFKYQAKSGVLAEPRVGPENENEALGEKQQVSETRQEPARK